MNTAVVDWLALEAIGTLGAFATGFILIAQERAEARKRADDERRSQAKLVSYWHEPGAAHSLHRGGSRYVRVNCSVTVRNTSTEPVYDASVMVLGMFPDKVRDYFITLHVIPPGDERTACAWWEFDSDDPVAKQPPHGFLTQFTFTDAAGRSWRRGVMGELRLMHRPGEGRLARLRRRWETQRLIRTHPMTQDLPPDEAIG